MAAKKETEKVTEQTVDTKETEKVTEQTVDTKETEKVTRTVNYWDELVDYTCPWVEGAEEEITVGHNGKIYKIMRGETVQIPRKVREVILDSEKQKKAWSDRKKKIKNKEVAN